MKREKRKLPLSSLPLEGKKGKTTSAEEKKGNSISDSEQRGRPHQRGDYLMPPKRKRRTSLKTSPRNGERRLP